MASNIEVASYDPKKVNLVMNGKIITGFASDSMITIARNEDTVTTQVGVKGDVACRTEHCEVFSERRDWGDGFYQETGRSFRQQHGPKCKKHQQGIPAPYKNHPQYAGVRTSPGEKI